MSGGWDPSKSWMQRFRKALHDAFDEPSMDLLTDDYFALKFAKISTPGFGKNFEYRLKELLDYFRMEGWLPDLVAAARERRPKNAEIGAIAEDLGLALGARRLDSPTGDPLEALVQANAKFITPSTFRERLASLEGQVCFMKMPGDRGGTGFLVGPDLVLTNNHVVDPIQKGLVRAQDATCLFDYREPVDGTTMTRKKTTEVGLAGDWLVDASPPSDYDWDPALGDASDKELDFALVRIAEPVGDVPLGGPSDDPGAEPRMWVTLAEPPPALAAGNQVFLLQHPLGEPLQLAVGKVTTFNATGTRVRHDANSKRGSSGSPCFDADLQLVALHHAHDPAYPPAWNQAIPLAAIAASWRDRGIKVTGD